MMLLRGLPRAIVSRARRSSISNSNSSSSYVGTAASLWRRSAAAPPRLGAPQPVVNDAALPCAAASRRALSTRATAAAASGGDQQQHTATASPTPAPPPEVTARAALPAPPLHQSRFCRHCGGPMRVTKPEGDAEWRHVCTSEDCGQVEYFNPKLVVGCIVEHAGRLLLCRRAIEPCRGKWTTPAGFLELRESTAAGAARETWEEAGARVEVGAPFMHLDIPAIGQAYLLFAARLAPPFAFAPATPESLEVRLFSPAEVADLAAEGAIAFSSVQLALEAFCADLAAGRRSYHHGAIERAPGAAPNAPGSFRLVEHFALDVAGVAAGCGGGGGGGSGLGGSDSGGSGSSGGSGGGK